jgi:hypothetical protein
LEEKINISTVIKNIARDFSVNTGIQLSHIHTTWEFYKSGYYAKGEEVSEYQPKKKYPIIADVLIPDFNESKIIEIMLESIASSISKNLNFPKNNIFINIRVARSSMVFDDGQVVTW